MDDVNGVQISRLLHLVHRKHPWLFQRFISITKVRPLSLVVLAERNLDSRLKLSRLSTHFAENF